MRSGNGEMVGFGGIEEVEPNDGFNMGSEGGERSQCWSLGVETEHLGDWGRWREKGNGRVFSEVCHLCNDWTCFP